MTLIVNQYVCRLNITMNNAPLVRFMQDVQQLVHVMANFEVRKLVRFSFLVNPLIHILYVQERHYQGPTGFLLIWVVFLELVTDLLGNANIFDYVE